MSKGNREPRTLQSTRKSPPNASKEKPKKQDLQREQIVQDRTAQLQATNTQLQAEIAECKAMHDKLRESEKSFRELVQYAPVGIYQVDFRPGKITSVNEVVCQQTGYTREELLNMNSFDILDEAGQALFAKRQQQWLAGEAPTEQAEYKIIAKDGHEIYAIMNVTFSRDEKGAPLGATVIAYDITERKRLEQQIQDIANKFLLLFDSTSDGVWISSPEGIILEVNEAYCRMSGYDEADLIGSPISLVEAAETEAEIGTHIHKLIEMGGHERFESRHRRKDGSTFDVDITTLYMEREGGQIATFIRDITERKKAEEALVRSNAKLGEVLDSIQDDFYVLDREWKFVYASRSFTNKVGKEPKDFIGNCIWEMFPKHIGTSLEENFRASMEKGEIRRFEIGGKYTQTWYSMTSFPSAEGITVLGTDITERKQAEERLLQSEERFRAIASSTPDHILVQDRDLRYTFVANPQLGLSEKDMLGKTDQDFLAKEVAEHLTALKKQVLESGKALQVDMSALNAEGKPEFFSGSYVPRFDAKGQVDGLIGYFRNITNLKQAEETLRQSEERYRMLVEQSADAIFVNREDKITLVNRAALDLFGADSAAQLLGMNPFDLFHSSHHALIRERMRTLSAGGTVRDIEVKVMRLDGGVLTAEVRAVRIVDAEGAAFQVILHDVTERKEREAELKRLNRTLKALSNNNQAMMRADDELAYMNEVCQIVVEDCGHAMVWIGVAEEDEAKSVRPVASAGFEEGYLDTLKVTWADTERGRGPTGTAIRTGKMSMCRNMLTDPHFAPWREEALKRGYAASIVLPLLSEGKAFGAITIYSREPDPFGESEVALLEELAGDLAYGITMIRTRQAHAQAQEALQQSEARFRQLADAAFEGLVIHEDGLLRDVNARITGILGYESAELIGKQYWNFIDDKYHKLVKEKVRDGSTEPYEVELIHKDGRRVPVEVVGRPFLWQGRPAQVTALRDITERLETEEALRKSEQRFRSVLDNSVDVIYRLNARTGKFEYVSPSAENVIGYAPAELMAQDLETALSLVHPEDAAAMKAGLESLEEAGTGDLEYRQKIKSGEYRWISNHMSMIYDDAGQPLYRDGNIRDITRRKQAEEKAQQLLSAVQAEKERLTTLINNISDEVWFANVDKHFTLANPAALKEFAVELGGGLDVETFATSLQVLKSDGSPRPIDEAPPLRALQGETVKNQQEIVRVPTSGELRYREVNASPVRDAQGQIIGAVSVVRDISERKKAEEALRESEKRYRALFDSMSEGFALHEILCDEKGVPCDYRFLEVNPAFERLTGLKREEVIGRTHNEVLPNDNERWLKEYGSVALTGQAIHFEDYSPALKQHYDVSSYSPAPNQFAVIFMNITERKRTEEALRENERRFREQFQELSLIYKSSPVGLFAVDRDMRFIRLNEQLAEISGRTVEEHLGCKVDEILPGLGGALSEMWTQALEEGKSVTDIEISGFSPGEPGEMRHWLANYYPIKSEDGEVIGVSGAVMDITERKVMEEALRVNLAKYTTLFEAFPLGITVSDPEGGILETNREAAKLLGIPEKEHLRRKIDGTEWQIIRPDGTEMPPEEYASVRALKEKHRVENQEMGILKDGGQVTWISVTAAPLLAEGYGAVVTYSDITDRRRLEMELEQARFEAEQRANELNTIFDSIADGIVVFDAMGQVRRANQVAVNMLGFDPANQKMADLANMLTAHTTDGKPLEVKNTPTARALQGQTVKVERYIIRNPIKSDIIVTTSASPLWAGERIVGAVTSMQDVTAHYQAEEIQAWLASFPELNPNPVAEIDPSRNIQYMNPACQRIFPDMKTRGKNHPWFKGLGAFLDKVQSEKGSIVNREVQVGEDYFLQSISLVPQNGRLRTYGFEITARKKAEQALEKSNERQALLSETVSQLLKSTAPQEIVKGLCQKVLAHLDCQVFFNYLVEKTGETETNGVKPIGHLRLNAYGGIAAKAARSVKQIDFGVAVCGCVARDGVRIVVENIPETPDPRTDLVRGLGVQAYACHPLMVEGKVIGTLSFGTRTRTHFSGEDLALMEAISDHVAIAMGRYKTDEALRQARDELELRVQERTLELQTTNEQLARERQRFNNVLDNLPAYLVLLTPDHHVPFANRYFEERFGKSEGRRCYEYLFNRSEPCENCQTYRTLKEDAPQRWEWTGPDKRIYDIHDFPFIDVDGSELILEMGIDVTERRQAEAELERYRQHLEELVQERTEEAQKERTNLQKIFDVVNVGMMLIGEDGRVKRINDVIRRWTGKEEAKPGSLQPGDALACIHALSNPEGCGHTDNCSTCRIRKSFESVIKSGRPRHGVEVESTLVREGKQKHQWLDISADPLEVDGQRHVILALNDITARKEAEQALRQARDELEERVRQRTQELSLANAQLTNEVSERKQAQGELQANMEEMQVVQEELYSTNTSLLAAQANIESERRKYQNLFDFAPIIYLTTNTVGVIWEANKTAQDLLKSPDEPLIGKDLADFLTEPDQPGFAAMLYRLQQTEHIRDWETSLILPDGKAHQVSISASRVEDPVQGKTDLRWLIADISERKRTEALLRLQTTAMEAAASGIFITNRDGAIQYCNPSFTKMTGYAPEEAIGQTPRFLKSGRYDRAFYRQMWKTLLSGQVWHGEIINQRKDGSLYTEDEIITPVRDENGEITHFIAVKQDISARRQAEEAIRQANAYNRSLLEASLDPLATITPEGKIGDVNSATEEVTGRKREELIGTDFHSYFSNPEKARLVYQKVFETGSVHDYELEIRHKDGHIVPVMYNASVYRDENSQVRGVFAVARDITERKRFEAQLVQAEKHAVIGRMVGSVTHEINNPLQTIKNCLYLIKQDIPGDSSTTEPLEMAVSETTRLSNLVGQLRELYRPRTDLQEHPHEVRDILEEVRALLTAHLNNSRVRWDPLTGMPRCTINCVRDQILEVFLNISMNAIEAMKPTGGTLSVEMKTSDEQVGLVFRDSGPGIPEEILPHIFEPFVTTKGSGLGLGLSISYGIIQRHGGQIVAENCPKGGASFTVWLPVARKKSKETKKNGHSRQHTDRG